MKLYFGKTFPLDGETGPLVAAVLRRYMERMYPAATVDPQQCTVLDLFEGTTYCAPKADRRRLNSVEAACNEIRTMWASA